MAKFSIRRLGVGLLQFTASRYVRWFLIVVGLAGAAWLGWQYGWQPLQQEVALPAGVTPRNPQLDVSLLRDINDQRVDRVQHRLRAAVGLESIFVRPTPTPR